MRLLFVLGACAVAACNAEVDVSPAALGDAAADVTDAGDATMRTDDGHVDGDAAEARGDAGCFVWKDSMCGYGARPCTDVGDGLCHALCTDDADCVDPAFPHCSVQGLWKGGDFGCNGSVLMCRSESKDDCERKDASYF